MNSTAPSVTRPAAHRSADDRWHDFVHSVDLVVIPAVYAWIKGWSLAPGAAPVFGHVTGVAR